MSLSERWRARLCVASVFLGSALLFVLELMAGKALLPRFGGASAVWIAAMLFFQAAVLGGYWLAHLLVSRLRALTPAVFVLLLLGAIAASINLLRITGASAAPPQFGVLAALLVSAGAPLLVLPLGTSLLQYFYANGLPVARPYALYMASNLGSFTALLAYPTLIEPAATLSQQRATFPWLLGAYSVLAGGSALLFRAKHEAPQAEASAPSWKERLAWLALAAVPSSLLLGVTSFLTGDLAPIPMLWAIPLALYLLSFVVAFSRIGSRLGRAPGRLTLLLAAPLSLPILLQATSPLLPVMAMHLLVFFIAAVACHSLLASLAPAPARLTEFYLWLALGGLGGGVFNALIAPSLFAVYFEYPLALALACILQPGKPARLSTALLFGVGVGVLVAAMQLIVDRSALQPSPATTALVVGVPALATFLGADRPKLYGAGLLSLFAFGTLLGVGSGGAVVFTQRSFYGVTRVVRSGPMLTLIQGTTRHGRQDLRNPDVPLAYYHPTGPIGSVFESLQPGPREVGVVGLGAGSMAAYGRSGDYFTFFELDPVALKVARDWGGFTYLAQSKASIRVVMGDARLNLRLEAGGKFDLLALDAFSSDAVPFHLLTMEAMRLYLSKLKPGGVLAYHISSRYLDFSQLLARQAVALGAKSALCEDLQVDDQLRQSGKEPSKWLVVAPGGTKLPGNSSYVEWEQLEPGPGPTWTDDFTNVLQAFRPEVLGGLAR